jgi:hypothetical protein
MRWMITAPPVLPIHAPDCPFERLRASENREFTTAIIVDPPVAGI